MTLIKLEDVITTLWDIDINPGHPAHKITYFNRQGWLDKKIESVSKQEHDGGRYSDYDDFEIVLKDRINFYILKEACRTNCSYSIEFFGNEDALCVHYNDPLQPILLVKNEGTMRFKGKNKDKALEVINAYLKEVLK